MEAAGGRLDFWLCGYVALWLCSYAAVQLCGYVAIFSFFLKFEILRFRKIICPKMVLFCSRIVLSMLVDPDPKMKDLGAR